MLKFIDTITNAVKLALAITALTIVLAVLGGLGYGGLWLYRLVALLTSTPIQMPTIEAPEIKVTVPTFEFAGQAKRRRGQALVQAWKDWEEKSKAVVAGLTERQRNIGGQWQDANTGKRLALGWNTVQPPNETYEVSGTGEVTPQAAEWHWIYSGPVPQPSDLEARLKAGKKPGRWFDQKSNYCIYGWQDMRPDEFWNYNAGNNTWFGSFQKWVWIEDGKPLPFPEQAPDDRP